MKKVNLLRAAFSFLAVTALFSSCSSDENDILKGGDETNHNLIVTPSNEGNISERNLNILTTKGSKVSVKVNFTGKKKMRRLYMTKNTFSSHNGPQPYEYSYGKKKADGSIDLDGKDKTSFEFNFKFDAPKKVNDIVQYVLWTTNDRGDFRNISKRNSIASNAYGVITIKSGKNTDTSISGVKSFSQVLLAAPLKDGSSKSFLSLFDNKAYAIKEGVEVASLWDFGYYFGNTGKASFASAANYPTDIVDVKGIGKTTDLNNFYFKKSSKTVAEFNSVSKKTDLNFITKSSSERINNLIKNDIIEFQDTYGNKGLIKITSIVPGTGVGKKIEFDVKVQINAEPIKG